ncbi:NEDD4-binding protein 2 isoform X2 [Channa argus]|uniref:NEDD4-binding protein 2 isoform X2 n=1 Tax=Channa argus TaxID=215402 RepID=UPI003520A097
MPRRKKNGQSPARVPGGPSDEDSLGYTSGYRIPQRHNVTMANNFPSSVDKDTIVKSMVEMFSHLDPEVIYVVLSEWDFKVENAMDSLLELSVAAEVAAPIPSPISGFERTAAALLRPYKFPEPRSNPDSSKPFQQPSSPPFTNLLTDELDLLVDQELETLTAQQNFKDEPTSSQSLSSCASLSFYPPLAFQQQVLPELLQSSIEPRLKGPPAEQQHMAEPASPLDKLSTWEDKNSEGQHLVVDFTHLMAETSENELKPPLDLAASGRPSAFQVYKKQDPVPACESEEVRVMQSEAIEGGARSKVNMLNQESLGSMSTPWNLQAPEFSPQIHGNEVPSFITPVAQHPSNWPSQLRHASSVSKAPLKPSATIPKSWAVPAALHPPTQHNRLHLEGRLLVLLRGAPGSGKSTMARELLAHNPGGVILSTDDYFTCNGEYWFKPTALEEAHEWNHKRAKEAFEKGTNPIIIDNTNMQGWEMKPYVAQALKHGYKVLFREPDTAWKNKPRELARRTSHNVPVETIRRMLTGYERFVTVHSIMGSQMPESKKRLLLENRISKPISSQTPCPDLVGQPGLIEGYKNSHPQLFSSLPDVSSIGCSGEIGMVADSTNKSTESLNFQPTERPMENPEISDGDDDMNLGDLDPQLDAQLELNQSVGGQRIPDCIVESVMNEDQRADERPVAFSESIGQRVRRVRPSRMELTDLLKDTNQSERKAKKKEKTNKETRRDQLMRYEEENGMQNILNFEGDWPSQGSLEQRQVRRTERQKEGNGEEGVAVIQTSSSCSSSPSQSFREILEEEEEAGGRFEELHCGYNSEERVQNINSIGQSRSELPDCVLDWKSTIDNQEKHNKKWSTTGWNVSDIVRETAEDLEATKGMNPLSGLTVDSLVGDSKVCCDEVVSHSIKDNVVTEPGGGGHTDVGTNNCTEDGRDNRMEFDTSLISYMCEGSQERKQRHSRRSGKHCKLALTFTQNCPGSSLNNLECPSTTAQNRDISQNTSKIDFEPNFTTSNSSLDLFVQSKSEANLQPHPLVDTGCFTQTEPHDFALLWRLNHPDSPDNTVITVCSPSSDFKILSGDSSRFMPELSSDISTLVAVQPSGHKEIPYRVVFEKGTQVEEKELGAAEDRLESLRILSLHFRLVGFDTLEDLYDKCHHDLEWTTNLLLDSGERFFRHEDGKEEKEVEGCATGKDDQKISSLFEDYGEASETSVCTNEDLQQGGPAGFEEGAQEPTSGTNSESHESSTNTDLPHFEGVAAPIRNKDHPDTTLHAEKLPQVTQPEARIETENKVISELDLEGGVWGWNIDDGVEIEESRVGDKISSMDNVHRLLQAELEEIGGEEKQRKEERTDRRAMEEMRNKHLDIQSLELKLPTELALQLTELFGPVGVDPGTCSGDDYEVQMDLNLAKLLHHKWKETIQERQRQAILSFHLLKESSVHWGECEEAKPGPQKYTQTTQFLISTDSYASQDSQAEAQSQLPFMDHWNVSRPHVSLRDIMKEEQALQENVEMIRHVRADLNQRDGATKLKENQLYSLFPTIDRHFLQDIFRDNNYNLMQTELFLRSLLDEEIVKTVVAPEVPRSSQHRAASKGREKKHQEPVVSSYQDTEDPEYDDFRAEASLQRTRQIENFTKAAEAYKQGRKEVASFYAQQGHLHGQRMREANHRAAAQIFERVNSSLLPNNILDLHGLHVDEALEHLAQVLQDKTTDCEQGLCRPQLSVITGRGNHSQGGLARIRPAVIDYLTNRHYRCFSICSNDVQTQVKNQQYMFSYLLFRSQLIHPAPCSFLHCAKSSSSSIPWVITIFLLVSNCFCFSSFHKGRANGVYTI